jgi:SAM-dependent methyltransferase
MSPSALPVLGPVINSGKDILKKTQHLFSITGKKVLLIGYSESEINELIAPWRPSQIICLTNWENHPDARVSGYEIIVGDLCSRTPFADSEFDFVITLSVLEHLWNVELAFIEVKRILKPNAVFASFFGPAWSSPYGHHLYIDADDRLLNFTSWCLPAHFHLLSSPDEISTWYRNNGYSAETAARILHGIFSDGIINRLPFAKYLELSYAHFQLYWMESMYSSLPSDHLQKLFAECGQGDYSTYGASLVLVNSNKFVRSY